MSKHLVVTIPEDLSFGMSSTDEEKLMADIAAAVDHWRADGPPLIVGPGISIDVREIDLDGVSDGLYIVGGKVTGLEGTGSKDSRECVVCRCVNGHHQDCPSRLMTRDPHC